MPEVEILYRASLNLIDIGAFFPVVFADMCNMKISAVWVFLYEQFKSSEGSDSQLSSNF